MKNYLIMWAGWALFAIGLAANTLFLAIAGLSVACLGLLARIWAG